MSNRTGEGQPLQPPQVAAVHKILSGVLGSGSGSGSGSRQTPRTLLELLDAMYALRVPPTQGELLRVAERLAGVAGMPPGPLLLLLSRCVHPAIVWGVRGGALLSIEMKPGC